ncbi:glycosyltransferase family 39 protein [Paraconexibacter sp.]|uniref:glycosyltransferase family 39 protein n=1 Tax=Paraconexibacter sp. TaxID=2949640 RepID=UPI003566F7C9
MTGRARTALIGIVVLAAALRFPTLGAQSYWADEAATVDVLRHGAGDLLGAVRDQESTPPLYYVLAWVWTQVLGDGEAALRSLSALAGVATVPVLAAVARRLAGVRAALIAALLVATNPLLVWFSQEARAYALLVLLAAVSVLLLQRALESPTAPRLVAWGVVAAFAFATHFFALFLVLGEAIWLVWALRGQARMAAVALAAPFIAGLALLPLALDQREAGRAGFISQTPLGERVLQVPKQLLVGYDAPAEALLTALGAALALLAVAWAVRVRQDAVRRLGLVGLGSVLVPVGLALAGDDYVVTRNLIAAVVPLIALLGVGFAALPARTGLAAAALAGVLGTGTVLAVQADPAYQREDWRAAVRALGPAPAGPRAVVVVPGSGRVAAQHYLGGGTVLRRAAPAAQLAFVAVAGRGTGAAPAARRLAPLAILPPPVTGDDGHWAARALTLAPGEVVDPLALQSAVPEAAVLLVPGR